MKSTQHEKEDSSLKVLVCNAGSTSLKFKLFDMPGDHLLADGKVERVGSQTDAIFHYVNHGSNEKVLLEKQNIPTYEQGIDLFLAHLTDKTLGVLTHINEIERVGFKTVLAKDYYGIHELTPQVLDAMRAYLVVAPAHNRPYLDAIRQIQQALPAAKLIGAFETAFHTTIPLERKLYGVPYEWYEQYGIQRFGYHGASHSYIAEFIAEQEGGTGKLISCHLGGSGSLCAIDDGKSMDNSLGFSLQTGLIHANRIGDTDAYLFPYLMSQGKTMEEIIEGMDKKGGLLGLSGVSNDLRDIEQAAADGNPRAQLAIGVYCHGILHYMGAYHIELGGLDHIVFTGGIGENSALVRSMVCVKLAHIGVELDEAKNQARQDGARIVSSGRSRVKVWVVPANEELGVARKTYQYT